jgi:phage baseplate assembly protein W
MNNGQLFGRGMSFPPRVGPDGRVAWSEGEVNIREAIRIILLTERQERLRLPDFGGSLNGFLFEPNTVSTRHLIEDRISSELEKWEPRVKVETVDVDQDATDPEAAVATITYKLVATGVRERVGLKLTLAG